ncbi:TIGR02301 family protein [Methyloceanibacter sp.]|uniref:TIGR02301 family protein n=1 Tax=Methyloceanibacter sp. TaxID=1965321 RepID=UPI003D6DA4E9
MKRRTPALGFGACVLAVAMLGWAPVAEAQFFWSPFFQQDQPKRQKARPAKPKAPADDLPPIIPRESSAPPPPDDRPYDAKLLRLAEILGAVHYLRELCGAQEGQLWRDQMKDIVRNEGSTAVRRAKLVNSFNDGYRGYRRTYRACTSSATLAVTRFSVEGAQIAAALAKPSHYASRGSNDAIPGSATTATDASPAPAANAPAATDGATSTPETKPAEATKPAATGATPQTEASQGQTAAPEPGQVDGAEKPKRKKRKAANQAKPEETQQGIPFFGRAR